MSTRQIILDTETTGLDAALGHRILEVAAVELVDRRLTGNHLHRYINPQRPSDEGALQVHGLTEEFLRDKPKFGEIANELLDFIKGAELVIHNASFDLSFLNNEFGLLKLKPVKEYCPSVVDTLAMARERGDTEIELSAQTHALGFYEKFGFVACGDEYQDVGIPHRSMRLRLSEDER
ncbi:MAG: GNAT family N-acetyltransferase [Betaproteobacteria bacterium]|nr:GNAT family N-acetyltransferase [Betaproteobacteria bacterium]